jgi:hypothetical protein
MPPLIPGIQSATDAQFFSENTKQMNVFIYESKGTDDDQHRDLTMLMSPAKVTHLMIDPCLRQLFDFQVNFIV